MTDEILSQEKMKIVKELADTNIKISEAKNILFKLQENETEYLEGREKKALHKIQEVLTNSAELLDQTQKNYESVHEFCKTISDYSDFLQDTHGKLQSLIELFNKRNELWEENIRKQDEESARQKNIIKQDTKSIEEREKRINVAREDIKKEREHIQSQQATLLVSFQAEKDLWNKIHKL